MTDIVERLREAFAVYKDSVGKRLIDEAADEIERLKKLLDLKDAVITASETEIVILRGDLLTGNSELLDQAEIENKRLRRCLDRSVGQANDYRAENERLHRALKEIATHHTHPSAAVARAALGDGEGASRSIFDDTYPIRARKP